jgi:hypothetical protein
MNTVQSNFKSFIVSCVAIILSTVTRITVLRSRGEVTRGKVGGLQGQGETLQGQKGR